VGYHDCCGRLRVQCWYVNKTHFQNFATFFFLVSEIDMYVYVSPCTTGATFCKCVNRVVATILAGSLGIAVHWVATQSGKAEVFVIGCSVFLFGNNGQNPNKNQSLLQITKKKDPSLLNFSCGFDSCSLRSYLLAVCAVIQSQIRLWSNDLYPHI